MKHNVYFDGKVQSLALNETGGSATVGVVEAGTYTFSTSSEEHMTVVAGTLGVRLPGAEWKTYRAGETFVVPPRLSFEIKANADAAYLCRYR